MKKKRTILDDSGFSLIELIVIMAIMTVAVGFLMVSSSLLTGSEAKKAARKFDSILNEVKTGAMSRYEEDVTVEYLTRNVSSTGSGTGEIEQDGYYAVEEITTMTASGTGSGGKHDSLRYVMAGSTSLGKEHNLICNSRVEITLYYEEYVEDEGEDVAIIPIKDITLDESSGSFTFKYDRATGKYKGVIINKDGVLRGIPVKIVFSSGLTNRNYMIEFDKSTGRHSLKTIN